MRAIPVVALCALFGCGPHHSSTDGGRRPGSLDMGEPADGSVDAIDGSSGGAGGTGGRGGGGGGGGMGGSGDDCGKQSFTIDRINPNLLIVLDKSGSMSMPPA